MIMNRSLCLLAFVCGVSCTLFSSYFLEYLNGDAYSNGRIPFHTYLPLDEDLAIHSDFPKLKEINPGTELAPKDNRNSDNYQKAEHEAVNTLHAAVQMCSLGRMEKARKLFEHALAISPRHPDILTEYGEFLERSDDVTRANQLYTRALRYSPGHSRALQNRRRTQPVVEQSDLELLSRIDSKMRELAAIPHGNAALRRVKKEAYFQQIHHTVGIEGNTMTLSETRHVVETRMAVGGRSVMEHNEVLGLDAAIKFINMTLVHRIGDITLHDILDIHRRVLGHVDPQEAGRLRDTQVYVSEHVPPPPARLPALLQGFVEWLNAPETLALHPIKYAALAHYKLVYIHPFADGNGRTSRLLMNLILMQAGYPPVIIRKQDRHVYYRALRLGNEGDIRPFIRFIAHCAEKTLDVYVWATSQYVQKIAMSAAEREAAAQREAAEYAFVRDFNADDDDLVGFGAAGVVDVNDNQKWMDTEQSRDFSERAKKCEAEGEAGDGVGCRDGDDGLAWCEERRPMSDSSSAEKHEKNAAGTEEESESGPWTTHDDPSSLVWTTPTDASNIIYVPESKPVVASRTQDPDEGYGTDSEKHEPFSRDNPGALKNDITESKEVVGVETDGVER